jgi:hypothetical protein
VTGEEPTAPVADPAEDPTALVTGEEPTAPVTREPGARARPDRADGT